MSLSVAEILEALPRADDPDERGLSAEATRALFEKLSKRPMPTGSLHRLWNLGDVHARVGIAYLFYWIRSWFKSTDARQQDLVETNLRAALKLLEMMGYLRGAVMKMGQTLANLKDIAPDEFTDVLEKLHFEAPAMHYSLIREQLCSELGGDPEELFDEFETEAFAAASLGQVHRARLKTGERVAIKVQYPGIGRTIRADLRNLTPLLLPARLTKDWENVKAQVDEVRRSLERETDYEDEARLLEKARDLFTEDDNILVPRVYREFSTARVLTMQFVGGVHIHDFLSLNPSQEARNQAAELMMRAWYRLLYKGRMEYIDWHPGNFLFQDGKLGLIDMGGVWCLNDAAFDTMLRADHAMQTGDRNDISDFVRHWCEIGDDPSDQERLLKSVEYCEHVWKARIQPGVMDFGDAEDLRKTIDLLAELTKKRYTRGRSASPLVTRWELAYRTMLYRLGAKIDVHPIRDEEVKVTC
ncbi:MAG: AarF/ABC1/UbiB kinase family protein [Planctomycetes bacterium]|nr:AarF/ABC1/UbiB kinase family protein [Planctomycetota bacterium]